MKYIKVNIQELIANTDKLEKDIENYLNKFLHWNTKDEDIYTVPFFKDYYPKHKIDIAFRVMDLKEVKNIEKGFSSGAFWSSTPLEYGKFAMNYNDLIAVSYVNSGLRRYHGIVKTKEEAEKTHYNNIERREKDDIIAYYKWDKNKFIAVNRLKYDSESFKNRFSYYKNNPNDKDAKDDKNPNIRKLYYENHPDDKDAKDDKNPNIRKLYYENNPDDKDAKDDESSDIRKLYYENNPDDEDAKKDPAVEVRRKYYYDHFRDKDALDDDNYYVRDIFYYYNPDDPETLKRKPVDKNPYLD